MKEKEKEKASCSAPNHEVTHMNNQLMHVKSAVGV